MGPNVKTERAVVAAAETFMRYGYARTTMGDIARVADMSRPALYLLFPGKEELFEAAVRRLTQTRLAEIRRELEGKRSLLDRLYTACDLLLVRVAELQWTNPDARDMDDLAFPVVREVYAQFQRLLEELILEARPKRLPASAAALARGLVFGIRGLGEIAADVEDMTAMMRVQVELLCLAVAAKA